MPPLQPEATRAINVGWAAMIHARTNMLILWLADDGWEGAWALAADPIHPGSSAFRVATRRLPRATLAYTHSEN